MFFSILYRQIDDDSVFLFEFYALWKFTLSHVRTANIFSLLKLFFKISKKVNLKKIEAFFLFFFAVDAYFLIDSDDFNRKKIFFYIRESWICLKALVVKCWRNVWCFRLRMEDWIILVHYSNKPFLDEFVRYILHTYPSKGIRKNVKRIDFRIPDLFLSYYFQVFQIRTWHIFVS